MAAKRGMKRGSVCYSPGEANVLRSFDREIAKANAGWKTVHRKLYRSGAGVASTVVARSSKPRKKKTATVTVTDADLGLPKSKPSKKEKALAAELSKKKVVTEKDLTRGEAMGMVMTPGPRAEKVKHLKKKMSKKQVDRLLAIPGVGSVPGAREAKETYVAEKVLSDLEKAAAEMAKA